MMYYVYPTPPRTSIYNYQYQRQPYQPQPRPQQENNYPKPQPQAVYYRGEVFYNYGNQQMRFGNRHHEPYRAPPRYIPAHQRPHTVMDMRYVDVGSVQRNFASYQLFNKQRPRQLIEIRKAPEANAQEEEVPQEPEVQVPEEPKVASPPKYRILKRPTVVEEPPTNDNFEQCNHSNCQEIRDKLQNFQLKVQQGLKRQDSKAVIAPPPAAPATPEQLLEVLIHAKERELINMIETD